MFPLTFPFLDANGYLFGVSVAIVLLYTQNTSSTWVKSVLLFVTLAYVPHNQEGVMNSPLGWFEVSSHRDVTT